MEDIVRQVMPQMIQSPYRIIQGMQQTNLPENLTAHINNSYFSVVY